MSELAAVFTAGIIVGILIGICVAKILEALGEGE